MKSVFGVVLFAAIVYGVVDSHRLTRSTTSEDDDNIPLLFVCANNGHLSTFEGCWRNVTKDVFRIYFENMTECVHNHIPTRENRGLRIECESHFSMNLNQQYAECLFQNIGEEIISMEPMDLATFKSAAMKAVALDETKKAEALKDFDLCMEADPSVPYSLSSYETDKIPEMLKNYMRSFSQQFNFGQLSPSPALVAADCMETALIQNGCGTTSEETVMELTKYILPHKDDLKKNNPLSCMHEDYIWLHELCADKTYHYLANQWDKNCTKGASDDSGCRVNNMKLFRENTGDCMLDILNLSSSDFPKFHIEGSDLSDEQKAAALTSNGECLAKEVAQPYLFFPFDLQQIPGPPLMQNFTFQVDKLYSIGNLKPSPNMRVNDCTGAAVILNGCGSEVSSEVLAEIVDELIMADKYFEKELN